MARALLLVGSKGGGYARASLLSKIDNLALDIVWLDKKLYVELSAKRLLFQDRRKYDLLSYDLIVYWPASFQNPRDRIGAGFSIEEYVSRSWRVVEEAMFLGLDDVMLNPYRAACDAANKALVFHLALENGIRMPGSLITNSARAASSVDAPRVAKTVTDTVDIDKELKFYTRNYKWSPRDGRRSDHPVLFQHFIKAIREYRAHFFGGDVIVAEIDRDDKLFDVRLIAQKALKCRIVENDEVAATMVRLGAIFGLSMFSADFIEDWNGYIYFLDLNPHGSWNWLRQSVRGPLDRAYMQFIRDRLR